MSEIEKTEGDHALRRVGRFHADIPLVSRLIGSRIRFLSSIQIVSEISIRCIEILNCTFDPNPL